MKRILQSLAITWSLLAALLLSPPAHAEGVIDGSSDEVNWVCTWSPCPWGPYLEAHAIAWPESMEPLSERLGYTTSGAIYLSAGEANGLTVSLNNGNIALFAGYPDASTHRTLATLSGGDSFVVAGLAAGEVLSVQAYGSFDYQLVLPSEPAPEVPGTGTPSLAVTGTCIGSPCPWGQVIGAEAIVWPELAGPIDYWLGYSTSEPMYLPAPFANGTDVTIHSGTATLYAGVPNSSSHRVLTVLSAGQSFQVTGLASDEVLSVYHAQSFTFQAHLGVPPEPPEPPPPGQEPKLAELVTGTCVSTPCPWGSSVSTYALAWPSTSSPTDRLAGYQISHDVYLPSSIANGAVISLVTGPATLYAGLPTEAFHYPIATLGAGSTHVVSGLSTGQVLSVQGSSAFSYHVTVQEMPPAPPGEIMVSGPATWVCDSPGCSGSDWHGAVINWPYWSAYSSNNRSGNQSRTVYAPSGGLLYPYMGPWAHGCEVTVLSGTALIVEWHRGDDVWRQTFLGPGDTHIIHLTAPEDGALIESDGWSSGFEISVNNCTPQPLP